MEDTKSTKRKRKKKEYWGKEEEEAVAIYLKLDPASPESERIFEEKLYEPLKKLVENIMFTYHLSIPEYPIDEQIYDCMSFVVSKMRKYDLDRGPKSFSYYGTIAKNYMILKKNKHYNKKIKKVGIDSVVGLEFIQDLFEDHEADREFKSYEFLFQVVSDEIENLIKKDIKLDANVYKLGEAIVYLLRNYQFINIHNKRQFYFIAREFTGLQAKEITKALQKLKEVYKETYKEMY